jgi:hypothetical protein
MQVFVPAIVCGLTLSIVMVKPLNALLLGEAYARTMGLNVKRARLGIITSTAVLAGAVTAFCGPIGFIGIAVPHLCRGLFGTSDHQVLGPSDGHDGAASWRSPLTWSHRCRAADRPAAEYGDCIDRRAGGDLDHLSRRYQELLAHERQCALRGKTWR